jgi:hypothetical protein
MPVRAGGWYPETKPEVPAKSEGVADAAPWGMCVPRPWCHHTSSNSRAGANVLLTFMDDMQRASCVVRVSSMLSMRRVREPSRCKGPRPFRSAPTLCKHVSLRLRKHVPARLQPRYRFSLSIFCFSGHLRVAHCLRVHAAAGEKQGRRRSCLGRFLWAVPRQNRRALAQPRSLEDLKYPPCRRPAAACTCAHFMRSAGRGRVRVHRLSERVHLYHQ